jgi:hypothetical protein
MIWIHCFYTLKDIPVTFWSDCQNAVGSFFLIAGSHWQDIDHWIAVTNSDWSGREYKNLLMFITVIGSQINIALLWSTKARPGGSGGDEWPKRQSTSLAIPRNQSTLHRISAGSKLVVGLVAAVNARLLLGALATQSSLALRYSLICQKRGIFPDMPQTGVIGVINTSLLRLQTWSRIGFQETPLEG